MVINGLISGLLALIEAPRRDCGMPFRGCQPFASRAFVPTASRCLQEFVELQNRGITQRSIQLSHGRECGQLSPCGCFRGSRAGFMYQPSGPSLLASANALLQKRLNMIFICWEFSVTAPNLSFIHRPQLSIDLVYIPKFQQLRS